MIYCNECGREFNLKQQIKVMKHAKGIEEVYFRCPHCNTKYTSYFTDSNIRRQQKKIKGTKDKKESLKLQAALKIDIDNLKDKILGTQ